MKKYVKILAVLGVMAIGLAGCGNSGDNNTTASEPGSEASTTGTENDDTSLADIKAKGEMILGLDASFPPMGFKDDNNEIVGYDIDVAKEVAKRIGVELKLQPIDWASKEQELNTRNIDCIWNGMTTNPERQESMTCSNTYMKNTQVTVVLADSDVQTLEDLEGKTVVIQKGSTASDAMDNNPEFTNSLKELIKVKDNVQALMDLGIGCDAVVMDEVVARYYTEKEAGKYRILDDTLAEEDYVIGFRKGEVSFCEEVEKIMTEMIADGTMSEIDNYWFKKDVSVIGQ